MAMQPQSSFGALSRVLERLGSGNRTVRRAEAAAGGDANGPLRATVEMEVPLSAAVDADAQVAREQPSTEAGNEDLDISIRVPVFPSSTADETHRTLAESTSVSTSATDVTLEGDHVLVTLTVTIDAAAGTSEGASTDGADSQTESSTGTDEGTESAPKTDSTDDFTRGGTAATTSMKAIETASNTQGDTDSDALFTVRDESVPPYEDTAYLQRLYDTCATFKEMSRRIEMDVSSETVRRYMIEAGVHSPTSYETDADDSDGANSGTASESLTAEGRSEPAATDEPASAHRDVSKNPLPDEQLVTDGFGFPDRLALQDVVDAVLDARTVYEVGRELGLEHDRTRQLLRQLNVLDLVLRRVAAEPAREITAEDVAARIRESAPDTS